MEAPKVREDIAKGVIGDVLHSEALFAVPIDKVDRIMKKEMGGGSVLDIGIYCVNWAQFVHGSKKPKRVITGLGMEAIEGLRFLASLPLAGTGRTERGEKTQPSNRFHSRLFSIGLVRLNCRSVDWFSRQNRTSIRNPR